MSILTRIRRRLRREAALQYNRLRVWQLAREISETRASSDNQPVLFFNASTRLSGLSQNAGFSLMISLMLQKRGVPVHHFVCNRGMRPCVLGTDRENPDKIPPCAECVRTSRYVFAGSLASSFTFKNDEGLNKKIAGLGLDELLKFEYKNIPLGKLILPSLRWILRRHHLKDDETTRTLASAYIRSAWNVYQEFTICLSAVNP